MSHVKRAYGLLLSGVLLACEGGHREVPPTPLPVDTDHIFVDVTEGSGLRFFYFNGMSGEFYLPEIMGSGLGVVDFDQDGDMDVYVLQGAMMGPGKSYDDALVQPPEIPPRDRLFRNDLRQSSDGSMQLAFTDVTEESGIEGLEYGMGVTAGDYDNDGWPDLYITNYGPNKLLHNRGDGTFEDMTVEAGVGESRWTSSAAFVDYDRDGWLDLFVANYVDFRYENHRECFHVVEDYCDPDVYPAVPDRLFRNRGDGSFEDVSAASQIARSFGNALGVVTADFDGDGWPEIFVANDRGPNTYWKSHGDGTFEEIALLAGCAVNEMGDSEAGMGVDAADFDADGDPDLFLTHLAGETNTLYMNNGSGYFDDGTGRVDLALSSMKYTGYGMTWFDYDNDGWLDLLVVNGAVTSIEELRDLGDPFPFHQPNLLFRNIEGRHFELVGPEAGPGIERSEVSRGAAFADLDNDGDTDVVFSNNSGPARVLLNQWGNRRAWIGLRLVGTPGKRDMLGALVEVHREGGPVLWRRARTDGSIESSNDPRVLVGLGSHPEITSLRIHWPDGSVESVAPPTIGRWTTLIQGESEVLP